MRIQSMRKMDRHRLCTRQQGTWITETQWSTRSYHKLLQMHCSATNDKARPTADVACKTMDYSALQIGSNLCRKKNTWYSKCPFDRGYFVSTRVAYRLSNGTIKSYDDFRRRHRRWALQMRSYCNLPPCTKLLSCGTKTP